jgi:anti-anti-sigma factor
MTQTTNSFVIVTVMGKMDLCTIKPDSDITASNAEEFRANLLRMIDSGAKEIVLDLGEVELIDSTGIGLIIATHNQLKQNSGKLKIGNASDELAIMFKIMNMDAHLEIVGRTS